MDSLERRMDDVQEFDAHKKRVVLAIQDATQRLGEEIYLVGALLYGFFWDGRYGPHQNLPFADVSTSAEDTALVRSVLEEIAPEIRWKIYPLVEGVIRAKIVDGSVEMIADEPTLEALKGGRVSDGNHQGSCTLAGLSHAWPQVNQTLSQETGDRSYAAIQAAVLGTERGGRVSGEWNLTSQECDAAKALVFKKSRILKRPSAPSVPDRVELSLEEIERLTREYGTRLQGVTREATDSTFREWLIDQVHSADPIGGRDETLAALLSYELFKKHQFGEVSSGQKPTHEGWALSQHLYQSALQLDTDHLHEVMDMPEEEMKDLIMCMRIGILFHDIGKLKNSNTPGAHSKIGAKLFKKLMEEMSFLNQKMIDFIQWIIETHDLLARLERGLSEKKNGIALNAPDFDPSAEPSYKGAISPAATREALLKSGFSLPEAIVVNRAIWTADVASVASLRWVLDLTDEIVAVVNA